MSILHSPRNRSRLSAVLSLLALASHADAQSYLNGFPALEQRCQIGNLPGTISLDTPTSSAANNFNWIVEVANSQIAVHQRSGSLTWRNTLGGNPMFHGSASCNTNSFFGHLGAARIVDTKVLYDRDSDRFCVIGMQQDSPNAMGTPGLYVAWSNNGVPYPSGACGGGGWQRWRTPVPNLGNGIVYQPDFNGMGQTTSHIIWSGILQPISQPNSPAYTFYRYFRKSDLNAGNGSLYKDILVQRPTSEFAHAADVFDVNTPMYLVSALVDSNQLRLTAVNVGNDTEINTLLSVPAFLPPTGAAPQAGGSFLDTIDGRIQAAVVRNGYLYTCHTVGADNLPGTRNVVRWYQIALNAWPSIVGTPQIVQSGTVDLGLNAQGSGIHTFMPSLAVDVQGMLMIAYARSAANERPSIGWSARRSFDPLGTTPLGGNNPAGPLASPLIGGTLKTGNWSYTSSNGTGGTGQFVERWGDWTSVVQDQSWLNGGFVVCGAYADYGPPVNLNGAMCNLTQASHWETWIHGVRPNSAGQFTSYGTGFPGTNATIPTLSPAAPFRIGGTANMVLSNSSGQPTLGIGIVSLAPAPGVPSGFGPLLWVDPTQSGSSTIVLDSNSGVYSLSLPWHPALIGTPLFFQAAVLDPGAAQGFSGTAGLEALLGA